MKKVSSEKIIETLITNSTIDNSKYKRDLESELVERFSKRSYINLIFFNMQRYSKYLVVLTVLLFSGLVFYQYNSSKVLVAQYDSVTATLPKADEGDQMVSGMKLATKQYDSISEAQQDLDFTILKPADVFDGALSLVEIPETFDESIANAVYLEFAKSDEQFLRIAQTKMDKGDFYISPTSTKVQLTIDGENVEGYYEEYDMFIMDEYSEDAVYLGGGSPVRGILIFYYNNLSIEVSEYGDLSMEQLVQIAQSI